ncbi:uncharacterized protein ASCRUDRAFT_74509, partial [Ascoidea rubescens DSM 1968]
KKPLDEKNNITEVEKPENKVQLDQSTPEDTRNDNKNNNNNIIVNDPITSFSNWWGSSGSKTVNSFFDSASHAVEDFSSKAKEKIIETGSKSSTQMPNPDQISRTIETSTEKVGGFLNSFVSQIKSTTSHLSQQQSFKTYYQYDEVLKIYLINDQLKNFNYFNYLVYKNFNKVLSQVQGSILIEINNNFSNSNNNENFKLISLLEMAKLYDDDSDSIKKKLDFFTGSDLNAEKLLTANIDDGIKTLATINKNLSTIEKLQQKEISSRLSHIFITVIPTVSGTNNLSQENFIKIKDDDKSNFQFLFILKDLEHDITIELKSQSFPIKWAYWLSDSPNLTLNGDDNQQVDHENNNLEDYIDQTDWVKDWVKDGLNLSIGMLAQNYIIERMGF